MTGQNSRDDFRVNAARYRLDRRTPGAEDTDGVRGDGEEAASTVRDAGEADTGRTTVEQRAQYIEVALQQAIRRGDFDNLPGAGQPLKNLNQVNDPDWWIRQKVEREKISGLGPPALTLRTENAELDGRLDKAGSETAVREILDDFNSRIIEARRQLQGGPPVVTPTRDVDDEVARWLKRRAARSRAREEQRAREAAAWAALTRTERRRAKRAERKGTRGGKMDR